MREGDTSIRLKISTRDRLASRGSFGQSFDRLINDILDRIDALEKELEACHVELAQLRKLKPLG